MHQHPRRLARQQTPERDKEAAVSRPAGEDDVEDGDTSHRSRICSPPFLYQHKGGGLNYKDNARGVGGGERYAERSPLQNALIISECIISKAGYVPELQTCSHCM